MPRLCFVIGVVLVAVVFVVVVCKKYHRTQ